MNDFACDEEEFSPENRPFSNVDYGGGPIDDVAFLILPPQIFHNFGFSSADNVYFLIFPPLNKKASISSHRLRLEQWNKFFELLFFPLTFHPWVIEIESSAQKDVFVPIFAQPVKPKRTSDGDDRNGWFGLHHHSVSLGLRWAHMSEV